MSAPTGSTAAETWFKRVLWLGILVNLGLAIPTLLVPERIMAMSRLPPAAPLLWPRFVSWLAVLSRLAGVVFFLGFQSADYHALGYIDLVFFVPELILLIRLPSSIVSRASSAAAWAAPSSGAR